MIALFAAALAGAAFAAPAQTPALEPPPAVVAEHQELHRELEALCAKEGRVGEKARAVREALEPHFLKEEAYALPPLAALRQLGETGRSPLLKDAAAKADKLRAELPRMLEEHKLIGVALRDLQNAGRAAKDEDAMRFAQALARHAQMEEEVLYPASLLIGRYAARR